jgi:two-component system, NtrC family, sensor histidine kinase HydH
MGAWARTGWLATTIVLAATLLVSSWLNYRAAHDAVSTLNTGQAEIISAALRSFSERGGLPTDTATLMEMLDSQREAGLRYIALLDPDGKVTTSVGESIAPIVLPAELQPGSSPGGGMLVAQGDRMRFFEPRPMGPRGGFGGFGRGGRGGAPGDSAQRGDRDGADFGPPPAPELPGQVDSLRPPEPGRGAPEGFRGMRFGYYVLEFEPVPASNIMTQASASLALSALGAGLLTLVALLFWQGARQHEAAKQYIEQQKRLSQLGEMSAVLAHEIRNPLASLKGNAQLLAERLEDGSRDRRRADRVVSEAIRLEALTTDLLDFARTGVVTRAPVDPSALLRVAAEEAAAGAVEIDTAGAPERWSMDESRIRQALVNLLSNAVQVSPEGRPPVARVAKEGPRLVYTVRDFGPGLKDGERERIFEPFFTTRTHGTGLGLPVARRVVEMHGGTLDAENHPQGGAVFRISLPDGGN